MIQRQGRFFSITTQHTTYCFYVTEQGFLQHLYYGQKIDTSSGWQALVPQVRHFPGNAAVKMVMADTRKAYGSHAVLHDALLQEARETLGAENVVVK